MHAVDLPPNGLVLTHATVVPEWLDYNGHMNVAYYTQVFDLAVDAYKAVIGLTLEYIESTGRSTVALESHVTYQQEAHLGDELRVETRVLGCDGKRAHIYQELYRDSTLLATQESLALSFDKATRRSAPFEPHIAEGYRRMVEAQAGIPRPAWVGRAISLTAKKPM
ncbi:MAG: thioesterase family protein [Gammaproteobacteria bacterium]|jgi:acyl-CoA thioester hydrolase|nr:thioesterase family protein [Gammaproteobacteria bacterium]